MTEAGLLAKVGINSQGLAVSLNILTHADDGGPVGVPVHLLLRELLATCSTVEDVAAVVEEAQMSASSAITVVDAQGGGATFELSPVGSARLEPDATGHLYHANIFLTAGWPRARPTSSSTTARQAAWTRSARRGPRRSTRRARRSAATTPRRRRCAATPRTGRRACRLRAP